MNVKRILTGLASIVLAAGLARAGRAGRVRGYSLHTVAGWQNQQPEHKYFDYGYYNLSSETGPRVIVNNQTGGATVTGYYNYGGTGPAWTLQAQQEDEYNITPINSIGLNP